VTRKSSSQVSIAQLFWMKNGGGENLREKLGGE